MGDPDNDIAARLLEIRQGRLALHSPRGQEALGEAARMLHHCQRYRREREEWRKWVEGGAAHLMKVRIEDLE